MPEFPPRHSIVLYLKGNFNKKLVYANFAHTTQWYVIKGKIKKNFMNKGEIILFQSQDKETNLDVVVENESVWLSQAQMVMLFERDKSVISRHIKNIFEEGELFQNSVVANFATTAADGKIYFVEHYNLDVIISVGYRVKSQKGTQFRIWANRVLKDYILKGYAIHERFERLEYRVAETENKIDFFVKTALPPVQGIFFEGQIFDAYIFVADLIKSAKKNIILIDNYIDESVLLMLSKRQAKVNAEIFTKQISEQLQLDLTKHNAQYEPINISTTDSYHDRFLIIDDVVYHIGASLKDLGKKLFAFSKMEIKANQLL